MSSRKKAKGGSVTDDMPSPSMLDGAALGATLDRIRVHCTTCDRPVATPREETTPRDQQNPAICYFNGGLACHKNEVDWRARCLAAEAENVRLVGCAVFAESVRDECENNEHDFNNRGGQHVGRAPGMTVSTNRQLLRGARFALDGSQGKYSYAHWILTNRRADLATSIARRALVEGLAECERLRAMDSTLSAFDILIGAPSKEMTEADLVEAMARLVTDPPSPMMDACEGAVAREQAIRAAAAREERERVVGFLRGLANGTRGSYPEASERRATLMDAASDIEDGSAYAIERGDHTAHAPGKGGEGCQ